MIQHVIRFGFCFICELYFFGFGAFLVNFSVAILVGSFGRISVGFSVVIWSASGKVIRYSRVPGNALDLHVKSFGSDIRCGGFTVIISS